jgi:mannose-1-phosphate guanylyltransferase
MDAAEQHDSLITVGVEPSRPETGYGYIQPGAELGADVRKVERFLEKPDAERAAQLIEAGALWNSGLFAWTASRFQKETDAVAPEVAPHIARLDSGDVDGFFSSVTPIAVDVSHFERSERVACVPGRFPWDDVGTWAALGRVRASDETGNVLAGSSFVRECNDCVVWADDGTVVLDGVADLVVVRANNVTLVTTRDRAANLKNLLENLPSGIRKLDR